MAAQAYIISKLINNNIVFSTDASGDEIILFGKAIGFGKKRGDAVPADQVLRISIPFTSTLPARSPHCLSSSCRSR